MAEVTDGATADPGELDAEDRKLVVLARSARSRTGAAEGAAVRDTDGRTYAAATVDLPSLRLSALAGAVAMAASAAARGLEAAAVLGTAAGLSAADLAVVREFAGTDVPVLRTGADGSVAEIRTT
jgi:hypothetical protein